MPARRRSRQRALQILYLWDARRQPVEEATAAYFDTLYSEESRVKPLPDPFVDELVAGAVAHIEELDRRITQHAEHWRIDRMRSVDRNILRLAVYEMTHLDTPAAVVIDEALELARRRCIGIWCGRRAWGRGLVLAKSGFWNDQSLNGRFQKGRGDSPSGAFKGKPYGRR
jgi:transcription antitermination protein NusB